MQNSRTADPCGRASTPGRGYRCSAQVDERTMPKTEVRRTKGRKAKRRRKKGRTKTMPIRCLHESWRERCQTAAQSGTWIMDAQPMLNVTWRVVDAPRRVKGTQGVITFFAMFSAHQEKRDLRLSVWRQSKTAAHREKESLRPSSFIVSILRQETERKPQTAPCLQCAV